MDDRRWPTYAARNIELAGFVPDPDVPERGSLRVRDTEGNVYLDAVGGIGCLPLGHGHARWAAALNGQMNTLVAAAGPFWTAPQQQLVQALIERAPVEDGRVFLGNTGTEVTEAAIKIALRATGRDVIIAFDNAFHGRSLGSVALTASAKTRAPYLSLLGEDESRFGTMNVARAPVGDLDAVEALLGRYAGRVAMVCLEPVQGAGGIRHASREFLLGLHELCRSHGALLGVDEIQAGSGRTGDFSSWVTLVGNGSPVDIVWWAKALGGGYPVAACVARGDLAEHMTPGTHGSTYGGNPLACRAALATLEIFEDEGLIDAAGAQFGLLQDIAKRHPIGGVHEIRGLGAMLGIELGDPDFAKRVLHSLPAQGLLATISGGTAIRWLFPYRVGESVLTEAWEALRGAMAKAGEGGLP